MKANELRIGNYVQEDGYGVLEIGATCLVDISVGTYKPKPIPITEEWLLKFGFNEISFKETSDNWFRIPVDESFLWYTLNNEFFINGIGSDLKYVHQLQNLYFALTSEELTIKEQL